MINNALLNFQFNGDERSKVETLRWQSMQQQIEIALKATLNTTQAALDDMKKDHFGCIVNKYRNKSRAKPHFVFDLIADLKPLKELTTPEQFADVILFFLLPWSRALTG